MDLELKDKVAIVTGATQGKLPLQRKVSPTLAESAR
jgi:hypothetical protein